MNAEEQGRSIPDRRAEVCEKAIAEEASVKDGVCHGADNFREGRWNTWGRQIGNQFVCGVLEHLALLPSTSGTNFVFGQLRFGLGVNRSGRSSTAGEYF